MEEADPVEFTKMHGLGNDFILVEDLDAALPEDQCPSLAQQLCHRRTGIGGDGLMFIRRGEQAPVRMRLYNSDGSLADMCGNGIRCFARYVYDHKIQTATRFPIETDAGIKEASLTLTDGQVSAVEISMGTPAFARPQIPMLGGEGDCRLSAIEALGRSFPCSAVNTGVPHLVLFLEEALSEEELLRYGPALETHPLFPKRTNVNFTRVLDENTLEVRTWERGCGRTLACGTGACAAAVCAAVAGFTRRNVQVRLALGSLAIRWAEDGNIYMAGPAAYSFTGSIA